MSDAPADPTLISSWLAARSIGRDLPLPVADRGGFRVDTDLPGETRRWVFSERCAGLEEIGREVLLPRHFIKLCGTAAALKAALPTAWHLEPQSYFMTTAAEHRAAARPLPEGYELQCDRDGSTTTARIIAPDGDLAASGYATEAMDVFIYDRIVTAPEHQRKGLGNIIMNTLKGQRQSKNAPELLVATEEGRGLYTSMGWRVISPFSTAFIPG